MATLSEVIEEFIKSILRDADGLVEIQRNELANRFNCVPSQINYVIDTRFTVEQGYYVESKRGGGGHIKIKAITMDSSSFIMHLLTSIGEILSQQVAEAYIVNLFDYDVITEREAGLFKAALSDKAIGYAVVQKDKIRAAILKNMLISLM
ncbi:MAG: CtsR family transcriptional regulator [Deltaproteobacteria bacterium]